MRTFLMGGLGAEGAIRDPNLQKKYSSDKPKRSKKCKSSKSARESTTRPKTHSGWFSKPKQPISKPKQIKKNPKSQKSSKSARGLWHIGAPGPWPIFAHMGPGPLEPIFGHIWAKSIFGHIWAKSKRTQILTIV